MYIVGAKNQNQNQYQKTSKEQSQYVPMNYSASQVLYIFFFLILPFCFQKIPKNMFPPFKQYDLIVFEHASENNIIFQ